MTTIHNRLACSEMGRRSFCRNMILGASLLGLGSTKLPALGTRQEEAQQHKFSNPSNLTYERIFQFAYANTYIPQMRFLAEEIGSERFLAMLKKACTAVAFKNMEAVSDRFPNRDLATFSALFKNNPGLKDTLTFSIIEDTEKAFEIKVTECLWAKTFLDAEAGDIGEAGVCFADYATATAFNPKLRMIRDKTLMQGHDCCNHRYVYGG
jgi:hypothetical protein